MAKFICVCGRECEVTVTGTGEARAPEFSEDDAGVGRRVIRTCRLCSRGLASQWWHAEAERWRVVVEGTEKKGEVV